MFHHILLMSFSPEADAAYFARTQHYVERVKAECGGVIDYFLRQNVAKRHDGLTHGIVGIFESAAAHDAYQVSPVHQEIAAFMKPCISRIVVLDTEEA